MVTRARPQQAPAKRTFFRYGARQRFAPVQTGQVFTSGGRLSTPLPRVGFLAFILARLTGTMTLSAAGALGFRGPWDLVKELVVRVNIGATTVYRSTGFGNYVVQRLMRHVVDPAGAWPAPFGTAPDTDIYSAPVAMGANTWTLTYMIPIAENYGKQSHLGLINLQAPEIQVNLDVLFASLPDTSIVTNFTSFTASSFDIGYMFYQVPDPRRVTWPPLLLFRTIESDQPISGTGDQVFTAPREGILHRVAHVVNVNDSRTNGVVNFRVRANKTDEFYRYDLWQQKWLQQYHYGTPLPTGVFCHEYWGAETEPGEGDNRDFVSAEQLSTLESIINTNAAVGGVVNRLDTIRQLNQVIAL